ncbi:MAG: cytochrome c biogenesis protein ResB [Phycisphaerae bacterium]
MNKFRRAVMWAALTLIILLIFLSIYGAFVGAQRAKSFFNSLSLAVYWLALTLLLVIGIIVFRRLVRVPGLLLIHAGCIFILTGAIWSSDAGHNLQKKFFGIDKIPAGQMVIFEGTRENRVTLKNREQDKELPFYVRLKDFRIEYYKPEYLLIQTRQGKSWRIPVEIGKESSLGNDFGTVTILRTFENFKIRIEGDKHIPYDDPHPGYNPALEVQIKSPDGDVASRYVFERFPGHMHPEDKLLLSYQRVISDYVSELQIIENNKVVAEKNIEVNYPLHFGGYHFYQHSYDDQAGQYTVLMVVSDTGLNLVYIGYLMVCCGVFWHLWLSVFRRRAGDG